MRAPLTNSVDEGGFGLDPDRLWVTVYLDDDEAAKLNERLAFLRNVFSVRGHGRQLRPGVPGPCGPCSEIYYDRGPEYGVEGGPLMMNRYMEI